MVEEMLVEPARALYEARLVELPDDSPEAMFGLLAERKLGGGLPGLAAVGIDDPRETTSTRAFWGWAIP